MKSTIIFKSSAGNLYLYDFVKKEIKPCHPLIYICSLIDENYKLEDLVVKVKKANLKSYTDDDIFYYCSKFLHYKECGYFSSILKNEFAKFEAKDIVEEISNINNIVFEVTEACNLQCKYCAYGDLYDNYDLRTNKNMTFKTIKTVFDYLLPFWKSPRNKSVNQIISVGFYGGEPLMNFGLIRETVSYCNNLNIPNRDFLFTMTTNATLIDKHIDFLVENKFKITISIDGDEYGNSYRVFHNSTSSFRKVFDNVKMIQTKYPEYFHKYISFNSVLHNRNSIETTHKFISENFNKTPEIHTINSSGIKKEKMNEFIKMYVNYDNSLIDKGVIKERFTSDASIFSLCQFLLWYGNNQFYDFESFLYSDRSKIVARTGTCFPFSRKMYITANGKILPCEKIDTQYFLGTINDKGIDLKLESLAKKYTDYYSKIYSLCKECFMINGCKQCIFQLNIKGKNEKIECNGFCKEFKMLNYFKENIDILEDKNITMTEILNNVYLS